MATEFVVLPDEDYDGVPGSSFLPDHTSNRFFWQIGG
jgi:hypothetical protein